jgi:hypothetical protein
MGFSANPGTAFFLDNADPDPGFYDKNWKKFTAEIYLSPGLQDVQATREVFIPQKRTFSTSKHEFFSLLWVILSLLDPDPYSQC